MLPEWRPEPHNEEYYFVSYAHEDYKAVYKDIFSFQSKGINIWFNAKGACGMNLLELWVLKMKTVESGQSDNGVPRFLQ